jgi:uncharacterized protein (TIGR02147 family)
VKSIFDYSDPNLYLKDKWELSKRDNSHLSIRTLANFLELGSHGPLHQMLLGKRKITQSYIPKIAEYFGLNERECIYFDTLVKFSRSQTVQETNFYFETLKELRPKNVDSVEILNNYEIQRNPIHFFIMELSELMELPNDYKLIKAKFVVPYTVLEVKRALEILIEAGHMTVNDHGFLKKTHKHLYSTQDKANMALVQYHKKLCYLAHSAIETQAVLEREYNGSSFNIEKSKFPEIKENIRKFLIEMIEKHESPTQQGQSTYQLSLQFFKIAEQ